jgi:tetratricopeptide (TPR) repeat protein
VARDDLTYREPAKVLNNLGWAYLQMGQGPAAVAVLEEAVLRQPNFCGAHYNLGAAYAEGDHLRKAVDRFDIVLELCDEQFPEAALSAGVLLIDAGHVDEGATYLQLCLSRWPDTPVAARCRDKLKAEGLL